jgi:hypothetical protein
MCSHLPMVSALIAQVNFLVYPYRSNRRSADKPGVFTYELKSTCSLRPCIFSARNQLALLLSSERCVHTSESLESAASVCLHHSNMQTHTTWASVLSELLIGGPTEKTVHIEQDIFDASKLLAAHAVENMFNISILVQLDF